MTAPVPGPPPVPRSKPLSAVVVKHETFHPLTPISVELTVRAANPAEAVEKLEAAFKLAIRQLVAHAEGDVP